MELTIISHSQHQIACANHVAEGVRAIGGKAVVQQPNRPIQTVQVCCWGWRRGKPLQDKGHDVLVMERAYLGDRFKWYSLGWGGLNRRAVFPKAVDGVSPDRFNQYFGHLMQPWKTGGEYVLLIGQVPGDASLQGRNLNHWYQQAANDASKAYGLPVIFRPHPVAAERGYVEYIPNGCKASRKRPLCDDLANAAACITWNSNTAVESVLAGVPTITMDAGSMAWDVTSHEVGGALITPDREQWAAKLAYCQWLPDEIKKGIPFED